MTNSKRGAQIERNLEHTFRALGFATMRAGSSGAGTKADRPDVLAARHHGSAIIAAEVKYGGGTTLYADAEEVEALERFAESFAALPVIAARFKGDRRFYLVPPDQCRVTDGGNYGVPHADAEDRAAYVFGEVD